jgi:hypothetical protein
VRAPPLASEEGTRSLGLTHSLEQEIGTRSAKERARGPRVKGEPGPGSGPGRVAHLPLAHQEHFDVLKRATRAVSRRAAESVEQRHEPGRVGSVAPRREGVCQQGVGRSQELRRRAPTHLATATPDSLKTRTTSPREPPPRTGQVLTRSFLLVALHASAAKKKPEMTARRRGRSALRPNSSAAEVTARNADASLSRAIGEGKTHAKS